MTGNPSIHGRGYCRRMDELPELTPAGPHPPPSLSSTSPARRSPTATSPSGRCWSTPTAPCCTRTATAPPAETRPAIPELELARWAAAARGAGRCGHRARSTRRASTAPCARPAHAWVGLGRIVYAGSTAQLTEWRHGWGLPAGPVAPLPINAVAPGLPVAGPALELADELRELHHQCAQREMAS